MTSGSGCPVMGTRGEVAKSLYASVNRLRSFDVMDPNLGVDLSIYRTDGEVGYERALDGVTRDIPDEYCGALMVRDAAILSQKSQIRVEVKYFHQDTSY